MTTRPSTSGHNTTGPSKDRPMPATRTSAPPPIPTHLFHHNFQRPELLTWALTHRSLSYETNPETLPDPHTDNEQLEFIGDAVLGLLAADALFQRFPHSREGELTRLRASLVSSRNLGKVAARIGLGDLLLLGKGEAASGGRAKPALLANALEAVIAALYLDGGLTAARKFVQREIVDPALPELQTALTNGHTFSGAIGDHKSALQEHLQSIGAGQPQYVLTDQSGPDHAKRFRIEVRVNEADGTSRALAESEGSTKKQAQQEAARLAFVQLLTEQESAQQSAQPAAQLPIEALAQTPAEPTPRRAKRSSKAQP